MRLRPSPGVLIALAVAAAACGGQAALAADDPAHVGRLRERTLDPGVSTNLSLVQQLLDLAGQLEQSALSAGGANLSANISRLNPSASASGGGASASTGSSGR